MYDNQIGRYKFRVIFDMDGDSVVASFQYKGADRGRWREGARGVGPSAMAALVSLGEEAAMDIEQRAAMIAKLQGDIGPATSARARHVAGALIEDGDEDD